MEGVTFKYIDADKVSDIATEFFKQSYSSVNILEKTLENNVWIVKVFVSTFGKQSHRTLSIDSKTGNIISCE